MSVGSRPHRFHFDLSHIAPDLPGLEVAVGADRYPLAAHSTDTRADAVRDNAALALLPPDEHHRVTHYADIDPASLAEHRPTRIQVLYDHGDPDFYLPGLVLVTFHLPVAQRRQHRLRKLAGVANVLHPKLAQYGVAEFPGDIAPEVFEAADDFPTPLDAAKAIVFHHPELASRSAYTSTVVMDDHIDSADNVSALNALATAISAQGPASPTGGWAQITACTQSDGTVMTYEYDFNGHAAGTPVLHYKLSDQTAGAVSGPTRLPLQTASNDTKLQNKSWAVDQGVTASHQGNGTFPAAPTAAVGVAGATPTAAAGSSLGDFIWTLVNQTGSHGVSVDKSSITFNNDGTFQIDAKNIYLRSLAAYAQLLDENGNPISNPAGWQDGFPSSFPLKSTFETDTTKYVSTVSAVNTIMGIPMPTDPTTLKFVWPEDAVAVRLLFGGAGTTRWDSDVDPAGLILTGIFQYGIPLLFMAAGAAITSTKWFNDFVSKTENIVAAIAAAFGPVGGGVATAAALLNTKAVLFSFSDALAGILVAQGMKALAAYVTAQLTAAELEDSIPYVGWACRVANTVLDFAEIAVSTGEILSSPATLEFDVQRAFDLALTVHPDPAHGEPNRPDTAVWPAVSDHYQVTVQYKGGTSFIQTGPMPATTSSMPLALTFPAVPAGGQLQIIVGIYSKSGWVCGTWVSDWMDALPDAGGTTLSVSGSITEVLVPLTADTQYQYKERIVYDSTQQKHVWEAGAPPTATVGDLDCTNVGTALCKPVDITIFERTFEIAYSWQGSPTGVPLCGQTEPAPGLAYVFQNLSVLADPDSRLKYPNCAVAAQPYVAYDQFGPMPGTGGPPPPNNFFLDPRNGQYHLRLVPLDDGNPVFDLQSTSLESWGQFPLAHLDAIVIHPSGVALGVSWSEHKMAILPIPATPSPDADAPVATLVSGRGIRQGLLQGPMAIAVTPDGRLLVLETLNRRVQAFDLAGNPVPTFDGPQLFELPASPYGADLDQATFSDALQAQFQEEQVTYLFDLATSFATQLDQATVGDDLRTAFAAEGVNLAWDPDDPSVSTSVSVTTPSKQWQIVDAGTPATYTVVAGGGGLQVYDYLMGVSVTVRAPGEEWVVADAASARSWHIQADALSPGTLSVTDYLSYMPLYEPDPGVTVTYLDLATESKGYVYVLSYVGAGTQATDYYLDIYEPNGAFLCRTPDPKTSTQPQSVAAARLAIDIWRNVFTLNFEAIQGPQGRTEPSIGHWMPSPPLFSLDLTQQPIFDQGNLQAVEQVFSQHGITLPADTTVTTVSTAGYWTVGGTGASYDAIRAGTEIDVYALNA